MIKKEHDVACIGNVFIIQATCSGNEKRKALASQWQPAHISRSLFEEVRGAQTRCNRPSFLI